MTEPDPAWQDSFKNIMQSMPNRTMTVNHQGDGSLLRQFYIPLLFIPFGTIFFFKLLYELVLNHGDKKIIIALVIAIVLVIVGISTAFSGLNKIKAKRIMNDPKNQPWQITTMKIGCLDREFSFNTLIEGKEKLLSTEYKLHRPIVLANIEGDDYWALAIQTKDNRTAWPMPSKLNSIDFTKEERETIRAAIERHFPL